MAYREISLHDSAARTATGTADAVKGFGGSSKIGAALVVSAASGTNPTLDVVIQHSLDGTNWFDLMTFTQRTAAGSEYKVVSETQGTTVNVVGDRLRAKYTVGGTTPSFTFSVIACGQSDDY